MRRALCLVAFVGLLGAAGTASAQDVIGPFCFQTNVAGSIMKFYFHPTGEESFYLSGSFITLFGSVPAMGTGFAGLTQFHMGAILFVGGGTTFLSGNVSLSTLMGSLACEDVDGGCPAFGITSVGSCP